MNYLTKLAIFAVLRSAGKPIKQALVFNLVSSALCFLGVIIGLMMANFTSYQIG